jgi:hypothetical protein
MHVENQSGYVQCGAVNTSWYSAMWTIAATGDGWNYIRNRWQSSEWIHIENLLGYAQYNNPQTGWYSAMWQFINPTIVNKVVSTGIASAAIFPARTDSTDNPGIFPNPAHAGSRVRVVVPGNEQALVTISDVTGKVVKTLKLSGTGEIDPGVPAGMYFVTIRWKGTAITKKLVIQ